LKISLAYLFIPIISSLIWISSTYGEDKVSKERVVGGQCDYKRYEGHARVISITKIVDSISYSRERYEVKFVFIPDEEIKESFAQIEGREFLLMLGNSSYPGPKFLEKYGIEVGKVLDCHLKVIIKGTCTPILFEFPSVRLDDYSEN
jgi:hypothetical protein